MRHFHPHPRHISNPTTTHLCHVLGRFHVAYGRRVLVEFIQLIHLYASRNVCLIFMGQPGAPQFPLWFTKQRALLLLHPYRGLLDVSKDFFHCLQYFRRAAAPICRQFHGIARTGTAKKLSASCSPTERIRPTSWTVRFDMLMTTLNGTGAVIDFISYEWPETYTT
jgi:hypothetical protein